MFTQDIIPKLKKHKLLGRGGAAFPTGIKWKMVKKAKGERKYIICNAAEGEPGVFKDGYILETCPEEVIEGIKIALETIDNSSAYIYLRKDYYQKFKSSLEKLIQDLPITLFKKTGGYISGEETTVFQAIEGKIEEPRIKPPYPPQAGLWGYPTLINNVETFYYIAKIAKGEYKRTRFYSISGDVENPGVYELPENWLVENILKETKNYPDFDFFIQSGGAMSGEIQIPEELNQLVRGQGAIIVYNRKTTNLDTLLQKWANFFNKENCDKCVPCREGVYRIKEMVDNHKIDEQALEDILFVMNETSFCALGKAAVVPFKSLIEKIYHIK